MRFVHISIPILGDLSWLDVKIKLPSKKNPNNETCLVFTGPAYLLPNADNAPKSCQMKEVNL